MTRLAPWVTAAVAGAAVMVVELAAGRMVTPVFGGGIEVWAIVIAVTLAALSVGYAVGGAQADRHGGEWVAGRAGLAAAVATGAIGPLRAPLLIALADQPTASGSAWAAALLTGPALVALGMVGPALVRAVATEGEVGTQAGRLYAVSTAGSLAGALGAGLVLLPRYPVGAVLGGTAAVVALAAAPLLVGSSRKVAVLVALFAGFGGSLPQPLPKEPGGPGPGLEVVFRAPSPYGEVRVVDWGHRRLLLANGVDQGGIDVNTGGSAWSFADAMLDVMGRYRPPPRTALLIGLGPGVIARSLAERGAAVRSVELDPVVAEAARGWFGFDGEVVVGDGRRVLARDPGRYDVVLVDAFLSGSPPWQLYTAEAFAAYRDHLAPGGLVVLNLIGSDRDPDQRPAIDAVLATARSVFATAEAWPDAGQDASFPTRNVYVVATDLPSRGAPWPAADGLVLTDAHAPLDALTRVTARHVRARGVAYLPAAIRVR